MNQEREKTQIRVTIQTGRGSDDFVFPHQTKVAEVIASAAKRFGFPPGDNYSLIRDKDQTELEPQRPLVSFGITDGEILTLSATGGGV